VINDMIFLSSGGVRSVAGAAASGSDATPDVGQPIDTIVADAVASALANGSSVVSAFYPRYGQYWLAFSGYPTATPVATTIINLFGNANPVGHAKCLFGTLWFVVSPDLGAGSGINQYATSVDGRTWTARTFPAVRVWHDVCYTVAGYYVLAATGQVIFSANGTSGWASKTTLAAAPGAGDEWVKLVSNGTALVAVSLDAYWSRSIDDGVTWSAPVQLAAYVGTEQVADVAVLGTQFCIPVSATNKAFTSDDDGATWTARTLPSVNAWRAIGTGNGQYLVVAENSTAGAKSSDGITWTAITLPLTRYWNDVGFDGYRFGVSAYDSVGESQQAIFSPTGVSWETVTLPQVADWVAIAGHAGTFVLLADVPVVGAIIEPNATVFVGTFNGGKPKWSRYRYPFGIEHFTLSGTDLYMRFGDVVRRVNPDTSTDQVSGVQTNVDATVQWGWLDFGAPLRDKNLEGFDLVASVAGAVSIAFGYDHRNTATFTTAMAVDPDTANGGLIAYEIVAPSLSVKLTFSGGGAWSVDQVGLYFVPTGGR
ncbi:MAG: sialidase family protein, partial [Alphaproteobacteria bacterium]